MSLGKCPGRAPWNPAVLPETGGGAGKTIWITAILGCAARRHRACGTCVSAGWKPAGRTGWKPVFRRATFKGLEKTLKGMAQTFKGFTKTFKGLDTTLNGFWKRINGFVKTCKGLARTCNSSDETFNRF